MNEAKRTKVEVIPPLQNTTQMETTQTDSREIESLIQTHRALATALEIKGALGTIVLQMDETLGKLLTLQRNIANNKGRISKLEDRVKWLEDYLEGTELPEHTESESKSKIEPGQRYIR